MNDPTQTFPLADLLGASSTDKNFSISCNFCWNIFQSRMLVLEGWRPSPMEYPRRSSVRDLDLLRGSCQESVVLKEVERL